MEATQAMVDQRAAEKIVNIQKLKEGKGKSKKYTPSAQKIAPPVRPMLPALFSFPWETKSGPLSPPGPQGNRDPD